MREELLSLRATFSERMSKRNLRSSSGSSSSSRPLVPLNIALAVADDDVESLLKRAKERQSHYYPFVEYV